MQNSRDSFIHSIYYLKVFEKSLFICNRKNLEIIVYNFTIKYISFLISWNYLKNQIAPRNLVDTIFSVIPEINSFFSKIEPGYFQIYISVVFIYSHIELHLRSLLKGNWNSIGLIERVFSRCCWIDINYN